MNPSTASESRAELLGAALELVAASGLEAVEAYFWPTRCRVRIAYPRAPDTATANAEMAAMIEQLTARGWSGDPTFHSHGAVLAKNAVRALLRPQNSSVATRAIELLIHVPDN